jgi:hypothetical protein
MGDKPALSDWSNNSHHRGSSKVINFHGVELDVEDTRNALEAATDEDGNLTNVGRSGNVIIVGDNDPDGYGVVANAETGNSHRSYIGDELGDELATDVYGEQFAALEDATNGSFDIAVRDAEVVDTRDGCGDHNALVAVQSGVPWNMQMNSGGWPYDDFDLRYFRTVDGDEVRLDYLDDVEMDNVSESDDSVSSDPERGSASEVGAIFYFMLDEE